MYKSSGDVSSAGGSEEESFDDTAGDSFQENNNIGDDDDKTGGGDNNITSDNNNIGDDDNKTGGGDNNNIGDDDKTGGGDNSVTSDNNNRGGDDNKPADNNNTGGDDNINDNAEDIGTEVLLKLLKMVDGVSQARNVFVVGGEKCPVSLTSDGLVLSKSKNTGFSAVREVLNNKSNETLIKYEDIFRVRCHQEGAEDVNLTGRNDKISDRSIHRPPSRYPAPSAPGGPTATCLTLHYVVSTAKNVWKYRATTLRHDEPEVVDRWATFINEILANITGRPRRLLVFVNPFGGKGLAQKMYNKKIAPLFKLANINCKVVVTERANHAKDLLQTMPLDSYDGVISVGGDGMFAEVFNGVVIRTARDAGIDYNRHSVGFVSPRVRVGFIPGGSTDAIAMCLHGTTDPVTSALHIILGDRLQVDSVSIHSGGKLERISMTMVSYGYFGDLLVYSERFRWLGPQRYDVSGVRTFLAREVYEGSVTYEPSKSPNSLKKSSSSCSRDCSSCQVWPGQDGARTSQQGDGRREVKTVSGRFLAVSSATLTCSCKHTPAGLSPTAHTGDGATDLIIVHKTSRLNYFRYLFRTAFQFSSPFKLPFVEANRVTEFTFVPSTKNSRSSTSVWSCDGEILDSPAITVKVHQQLIPIFARGIYKKKQCQTPPSYKRPSTETSPSSQDFFTLKFEPDKLSVD